MTADQPLRGIVVLVVEDDSDLLTGLVHLFTDALGCRVLTATSGDAALRIIDSGLHVDLVYSDVVMPEIDGDTLCDLIRKRAPNVPVVLATGRPDMVDSITERGGIAVLKPCRLERLQAIFMEQVGLDR
jgi:CheY-like chemotaxis protein